jgi:acetylglutamate/LysW-gamma-L-alpha-aminoadipate kinase
VSKDGAYTKRLSFFTKLITNLNYTLKVKKMLIVVKAGGKILEKGLSYNIASDIKKISDKNNIVFVHGGGIEVTEIAQKLGKEQRFVVSPEGFRSRYTDKETAEIYMMVMAGRINKQVVMTLQSVGVNAIGLSGLDGQLLKAERKKRLIIINERGRKMAIDGGYTGRIIGVNSNLLNLLMEAKYIPIVSPVALSEEYEPLNVDGDRVAASIAGALSAETLILLTDVEGLMIDGKPVPKLSLADAKILLQKIGPGMITKIHAAIEALEMGVREVIIAPGGGDTPISSAMSRSVGTVVAVE